MFTDIVETITSDSVTLAGAFFAPDHSDTVNSIVIPLSKQGQTYRHSFVVILSMK